MILPFLLEVNIVNCLTQKKLCDKLVISTAVSFAANQLIINIPQNTYNNGEKYCIVVAQNLPTATTITAPVVITIGTGVTQYPLIKCNGTQVYAAELSRRTRYSTRVVTNATSGSFKLLGKLQCSQCSYNDITAQNNLPSLPVVEAAPGT